MGVNPAFFPMMAEAQYDSWLTVGITTGGTGEISSIGIDFNSWTENTRISTANGALFWMDPTAAPAGGLVLGRPVQGRPVVVAQLTVRTGIVQPPAQLSAQGHVSTHATFSRYV